jgi:hypothetical protein
MRKLIILSVFAVFCVIVTTKIQTQEYANQSNQSFLNQSSD